MSEVDFEGLNYIPPKVAVVVGAILRGPREVGHSVQFSDWFSSVQDVRRTYVDGLSAVPVIFFSFFFAWAFITIVLKCKAEEVGCASGRAFISVRSGDGKSRDDAASTTSESSNAETISESSVKPLFFGPGGEKMENSDSCVVNNDNGFGMRIMRCLGRKHEDDETEINRVARGTRLSFLLFATIALACTPLCLFFTFGPLRAVALELSTTESEDALLLRIQNVMGDVSSSLDKIESLSTDAIDLINNVPTDLEVVCPLVNSTDFESIIGIGVNDIVDSIIEQQYNLEDDIEAQLSTRKAFVDRFENQLSTFETYADDSNKFIWILPGLLLTILGLSVISIAGVICAWREKSGARFERVLSYVVLPLLILVAIICWLLVMVFALSTSVGTDMCFSTSPNGSPDQTIEEILSTTGNETSGVAYLFASTYVQGCESNDPAKDLHDIKLETQEHIDNIWRQISKIDSVGRAIAIERCGDESAFVEMLSGARDLAMTLTDIRRTLSDLEESTGCENIHPLYVEAAYDVVCTKTLSASGYGFITFFIMWICVMAMISLRASWLRSSIEREKVYHDETEVAENMVVDEHEEYLAYISKYKHEWQEYEGIEEDGVIKPSPRSSHNEKHQPVTSEDSDHKYYYGDDEDESCSQVDQSDVSTLGSSLYIENKQPKGPPTVYQRQLTTHDMMDHHDDGVSYASGEISFASLSSAIKNDALSLGNILSLPPPLKPGYNSDIQNQTADLEKPDSGFDADFDVNFTEDLQATGEEVEVQIKDLHHF